jgi:hypothetical protein
MPRASAGDDNHAAPSSRIGTIVLLSAAGL